jgi:hypothetical protein
VVPIAVILVYAFRDLLWIAVLSAAVWLLGSMIARLALAGNQADWRMPERPAQPPARHPYLIMNPKSGGGKVEKFDLKRNAESSAPRCPHQRPRACRHRRGSPPGRRQILICSASPEATERRPWWPASPPNTASLS